MKKFTFFFAMALLFAGTAKAQVEELQGKAVTVGEEVMTKDQILPDQWYTIYQVRDPNKTSDQSTIGGYWWDKGANEQLFKSNGVDVIGEGALATEAAQYMVRFIATDTEGQYNIQFGTGNYINSELKASNNAYDAAKYAVYNIVTTNEGEDPVVNNGHWAFNLVNNDGTLGQRVDNNGGGYSLAFWESGEITSINGNNDHKIYAIDFIEMTDWDAAMSEAIAAYNQYSQYSGTLTGSTEKLPGTYDQALVDAFEAVIEKAEVLDSPESEAMSAEELKALAEEMKAAYEAVVASRVPFATTVADGYYLIQTSPFFTQTTTTEDIIDPETGDIIPGETTTIHLSKGMYAKVFDENMFGAWATYDETDPARAAFLWKVTTKGDKVYELKNAGYDLNVTDWANSNILIAEGDSLVVFDYNPYVDEEGNAYYNIRPVNSPERDYKYLHAGGHQSGAGVADWIVNWSAGEGGATEWKLVPVSEEDALAMIEAFAPIKNEEARVNHAATILADVEPKLTIAVDNSVKIFDEEGNEIITDVAQLSSPYTNTNQGEGSLEGMIDGVTSGSGMAWYWHSDWTNAVPNGTHYFQVEMADEIAPEIAFEYTRRPVNGNQITNWSVYGTDTNDSEIAKDACTLLANIVTPLGTTNETVVSTAFKTQGFKYLRFYCEGTDALPGEQKDKGFFHVAEFQLYPAETIINETSQAIGMGDVFTNMQTAVANAKADSIITIEHYNELVAAYEAFSALYVNPDTLRTAIAGTDVTIKGVKVGNNPGEWSETATRDALQTIVTNATAYDKAGKYTLAQSQQYVTSIADATKAVNEAANKVKEGKWYKLRFATEEMYDENEWDKTGAEEALGYQDKVVWPELFGKVVAIAESVTAEDTTHTIESTVAEDVAVGHALYLIDELELDEAGDAQFRFIAVGDTAYMIQQKTTGLFLKAAGTSGGVTLSIHPTLWKNSAMGFGKVMSHGTTLTGANQEKLHIQRSGNNLVTWSATEASTNTGFLVEEVEDVAADYDGTAFNLSLTPNATYSFTYPVSVTGEDVSLLGVSVEGTTVTLTKLADNTAKAGEPFIVITGDTELFDAEAEQENVRFSHGYELAVEPLNVGRHNGTYNSTTAPAGSIVADGTATLTLTKKSSTAVPANGSWINAQIEDLESVLTINVNDEGVYDAIESAIANVAKKGNIYTIDGKFVGKGNINTKLTKGMYIINGVKVLVK